MRALSTIMNPLIVRIKTNPDHTGIEIRKGTHNNYKL